jgi:hypothetical protein
MGNFFFFKTKENYKMCMGLVIPPCLGVIGGYHVSRPIIENMIYTMMMMINMSTYGSPITPLVFLPVKINQAHHIQGTQGMRHDKPTSP